MANSRTKLIFYDYLSLTKPTITLLVVVTVIPSLFMATGGSLPPLWLALATILGTACMSGSAAVCNQFAETSLDKAMERTQKRSLADNRIGKVPALVFAGVLAIVGASLLGYFANLLTVLCAFAGHVFYVLVYTLYLKPRTAQNIVIGGAAGAVGPLIGWAAVTGHLAWEAWVLALVIFLWTPPHFWALALKYKDDYARAGIPMYPVVYGDHKTRWLMFFYTLALIPCVGVLYGFKVSGLFFLVTAGGMTLKFVWDALTLARSNANDLAMPFFYYSCFYTLGFFIILTVDYLLNI
jgi:protoheme IX farnesyltransferase